MTPAPSRAAQYKQLLRQAAVELHVKQSSDRAMRLATIRLQRRSIRELQLVTLLSGKLSDPTKLLDADQRLAEEEAKLLPASSGHRRAGCVPNVGANLRPSHRRRYHLLQFLFRRRPRLSRPSPPPIRHRRSPASRSLRRTTWSS